VHQLFIDFKKAYDSVVQYSHWVWYPQETGKANKNVSDWNVQQSPVGKILSEMFPIRNGLKQGDALLPLFINFVLEYAIRRR
jgi:hypothetical protein